MSITCPNTGCGYTVEGSDLKHCPRCGAYLPPAVVDATDPLIGMPIVGGKFRIISVLGEGGMGKVYKGMQKLGTAERLVAIKTLQPDLAQDPQIVARFHRETETVVQLEHPNTIKFFDFGELPDGKLFVAMEFIQGESLAHVIARGALPPQRVEHILQQMCGSLAEAHEHGIVHRDLKPENIILTQKGQKGDFVKVLDFGIAKNNEADDAASAKLTRQGMVLGTPPYMSPEQFTGQPLKATSDIYSLAVMTYEMLTGALPYTASTPWEWATRHLTGTPTPFEQQPNGQNVMPRHKAAVMRALSRNAADRPQTTTEYLQMFTGDASAGGDWSQSTSTAQGYNSNPNVNPMNPTPVPMHTPGPFGQATPPPRTTTAGPGPQSYPTPQPQPGYNPTVAANFGPNNPFGQVPSSPGFVPAPSNAGFQAINAPPSNPGFNQAQNAGFGQPMYSNPGYSNQGAPPVNSGGGAGKIIAIIAVVFVVLAGGGFAAIRAMSNDDDNHNNNNGNNTANNTANNNNTTNNAGVNGTNGNNGTNNNGMNPIPTPQNNMQPIPTPQNNNVVMNPIPTPQQPPQQIDPVPNNPVPNTPTAPTRPRCPGSAGRIDDLILNGNCARAQSMFRAMRAAGCSGGAGDSFGSACPSP